MVFGRILVMNPNTFGRSFRLVNQTGVHRGVAHALLLYHRNEGPQKEKENILLLDRMEEWLGRKRPAVLGKEGAEAALERGEKTLADILNRNDYDDNSFGGENAAKDIMVKDGWVEGVGESRTDEDNLSLYLRFSEGAGRWCCSFFRVVVLVLD